LDGTLDVFGRFVGKFYFVDVPSLGGVLRCSIVFVGVEVRLFFAWKDALHEGVVSLFPRAFGSPFCCDMLILPYIHSCCTLLLRSPLEVDGRRCCCPQLIFIIII